MEAEMIKRLGKEKDSKSEKVRGEKETKKIIEREKKTNKKKRDTGRKGLSTQTDIPH